jgi:hypothetical protein
MTRMLKREELVVTGTTGREGLPHLPTPLPGTDQVLHQVPMLMTRPPAPGVISPLGVCVSSPLASPYPDFSSWLIFLHILYLLPLLAPHPPSITKPPYQSFVRQTQVHSAEL